MEDRDTIKLLKECDAGSKMAVSSLDDVMDKVENENLQKLLDETKDHHAKLGNEIHSLLIEYGCEEKDPHPMAKSMSKMKTGIMLTMKDTDETIADLMTDGCNMGVKSLSKYLNKYAAADERSKDICKRLIKLEDKLASDIRLFL